MRKVIAILLASISLFSFVRKTARVKRNYFDKEFHATYETKDGRIDGAYVSFYNNGQKKSKGNFENNYRIGKWTIWDSVGKIIVQRFYENPFVFKKMIPKLSNKINIYPYTLQYNSDGYIEYFFPKEKSIQWLKRTWRIIPITHNNVLFKNNLLFNLLLDNVKSKTLIAYADEEWRKELTSNFADTISFEVIGYKIKEENFFDKERLVRETRITGICPQVINTLTNDTMNLCWFWLPSARKILSQQKCQTSSSKIKTLDDLFFFRDFYGQIYKATNPLDREISTYKTKDEAESIEINIIENEHTLWLSFTR